MKKQTAGVALAFFALITAASLSAATGIEASVSLGETRYQGVALESGIAAFRGVPFALPPVGARRWLPPKPLPARPGVVDATRFAPACMQGDSGVDWYHKLMRRVGADPAQFPAPKFAEDCLYLNIWSDLTAAPERPVIVYIHGGSNTGGWSYEPNYRGAQLAKRGVVLVSVAYRVGVFGFLTHPELPARNMAIHDLALALQWVRRHVAAFGGDPQRITLMGESAGAANASHLMVSPLSAGIATRLIHQSGGWQFDGLAKFADAQALGKELERRLVGKSGGIDAMRNIDAQAILRAASDVYENFYFSPVPDPRSLPASLGELDARQALPPFDLLLGTNADESLMYLEPGATVDDWLAENAEARRHGAIRAQLNAGSSDREQLNRLGSAAGFACPSMRLASAVARAGGRSFVYRFSRVREGLSAVGAYHGAELPYVFDTHDSWLPTQMSDRELTTQMLAYWLSFAATGQPTGGAVPWPAWELASEQLLTLDERVRVDAFPDGSLCRVLAKAER